MRRLASQLTGWGTQSNGHVRGCNGQRVDLHDIQKIAFEKDIIAYIAADRDQDEIVASAPTDLCISMSIRPFEL
jgi:hypothetical protein